MKEFEGRSAAFDQLGGAVVRYEKKLTQYKEGVRKYITTVLCIVCMVCIS